MFLWLERADLELSGTVSKSSLPTGVRAILDPIFCLRNPTSENDRKLKFRGLFINAIRVFSQNFSLLARRKVIFLATEILRANKSLHKLAISRFMVFST